VPPGSCAKGSSNRPITWVLGRSWGTHRCLRFGLTRTLGMAAGAQNNWHVINAPGGIEQKNMTAGTEAHAPPNCNPIFDIMYYETSPKFSDWGPEDEIEFGGEVLEMGFKAELYQHT
jgi:hypothetical protein